MIGRVLLFGVALFAATAAHAQPASEDGAPAPEPTGTAAASEPSPEPTPAPEATAAPETAVATPDLVDPTPEPQTATSEPVATTPAATPEETPEPTNAEGVATPEATPEPTTAEALATPRVTPANTPVAVPTASRRKRISRATPTPTPTATVVETPTPLELPDVVLVENTSAGAVATITSALGAALAQPLPPVTPEPAIAPIIEGTTGPKAVIAVGERPAAVVWTILGLLAIAVLAYGAGDPRVLRLEESLGVSQVITAGFPFVLLGMIARSGPVGILNDEMLAELSPLLRLALGWIGFVVGFRFDAQLLGGLPRGTARVVTFATSIPFATVLATTALLLLLTTGLSEASLRDPVFLRDALILGTVGTMTAVTATRHLGPAGDTVQRLLRIEELAGIAGLALVGAYFRPSGATVSWQLPATAWLFLTVGIGATVGAVVYGVLLRAKTDVEFTTLTIGSISFVAGMAGYLHLSSVVVAFISGALLSNVPGAPKQRLSIALERLERPVYLLSLVVIGALWDVNDWRGWVLMPFFAASRLGGKWLAVRFGLPGSGMLLPSDARNALVFAPIGPLGIAIVVNAQLLYPGGSISRIVSAVIGGAVLTEIAVQLHARVIRERPPAKGEPTPARSEIDAAGGPA